MEERLRKKYIPMTETTYYTLLSVTKPRHGYAIMQYVSALTKGRIALGTGTLYNMVGRLAADGVVKVEEGGKKSYLLTDAGMRLLREETDRMQKQLADGRDVLGGGAGVGDACLWGCAIPLPGGRHHWNGTGMDAILKERT